MNREQVYEKLNAVFQEVFDDDSLTVNDATTAKDIAGWDSLVHITLIANVEEEFEIKLPARTVINAQTVGELVDSIMERLDQ